MNPLGALADGGDLSIDLDRLIGSHACIVANSGGGKSGLIRKLLETTHGRVQHIVLDVEDEFYTLRERFDYVVAGGDGDAPATVENAADLCRAALAHGFSLVAQLNDLGPDGGPAFVGRFLATLINVPREQWRPLLVVLDEAQRFAPQDGTTAASHGVRMLVAQGRKRGFTAILASQRIAKIDADVRGEINNWMLGRVGQSLDRRTMADALGFRPSSEEARGLQSLPPRTFWGFGPALAPVPALFRVADVETTPVRPGQAKVPTPPAPEALREILAGLAAPAAQPEASAQPDPKKAPIPQPPWPDQREEVARLEARIRGMEETLANARSERDHYQRALLAIKKAAFKGLHEIPAAPSEESPASTPGRADPEPVRPRPHPPRAPRPAGSSASSDDGLSGPLRTMLQALRWWKAHGHSEPSKAQVAAICRWRLTSGHIKNVAGSLKGAGLIRYPRPGRFALTPAGFASAPEPDRSIAFHDSLRAVLTGPQQAVFDHLLSVGVVVTRDQLAKALGWEPTSGHIKNVLGSMRSLELVDYPQKGEVSLQAWVTSA